MSDKLFIDTNILVYAHDLDAGVRDDRAVTVLKSLWDNKTGMLSTQVLQEFYVNVTRKITTPLPLVNARSCLHDPGKQHGAISRLESNLDRCGSHAHRILQ